VGVLEPGDGAALRAAARSHILAEYDWGTNLAPFERLLLRDRAAAPPTDPTDRCPTTPSRNPIRA
jgi:hypothetical protein